MPPSSSTTALTLPISKFKLEKKKTIAINHIIKFMTKTVQFTHTSCTDYIKDVNSTVSPVRYLSYSERYMTYQQLFHNLKAESFIQ